MTNKSPERIAYDWYNPDEVRGAIHNSGSGAFGAWSKVPPDVYSNEFAIWMTDQLRRAMAKGIQLGRGEQEL